MEPILDETSLVPCPVWAPSLRILGFARTLQALDNLGAPKVLRSVRDAGHRNIHSGRGLRDWCFDRSLENRDAGRLIAIRLGKQPFIDGDGGLFAAAEGSRAVESSARGVQVVGLGLAALVGSIAVALGSAVQPAGGPTIVEVVSIDDDGEYRESATVPRFVQATEVVASRREILEMLDHSVPNGSELLERSSDMFPRLRYGDRAREQIAELTGSELVFRQLLRHLRALDTGALEWEQNGAFAPKGISFSVESSTTLSHGTYGPMRDFPVPLPFAAGRFSLHTKLTGGNAARLYYRPERTGAGPVVLIGYFGGHLDTAKFHG